MERYAQAAPAKVNLALDILGRRPDGYHEMRMVMQTVSLCDAVTLEEAGEGFALFAQGLVLPQGKTLEQRAAEAFFAAIGRPRPSLRVTLEKKTPAYAGLGGGSADVAALLRLLRERYAPAMPREALEAVGGQIGSDMPFCVRGGTALAEGRGDLLTDLPPLPDCRFVICIIYGTTDSHLSVKSTVTNGSLTAARPIIMGIIRNAFRTSPFFMNSFTRPGSSWTFAMTGSTMLWTVSFTLLTSRFGN